MSVTDFYALTERQLLQLLRVINAKEHRELEVSARLHGFELKSTPSKKVTTKREAEALDGVLSRMMQGIQGGKNG